MEKETIHNEEDAIIREVAEEEGLTYEETKEMWEIFKKQIKDVNKLKTNKPKRNKSKEKSKRKQSKKSKKRNR